MDKKKEKLTQEKRKQIEDKRKLRRESRRKSKQERKEVSKKKPAKVVKTLTKVEKQKKTAGKKEKFKHLIQARPRNFTIGNHVAHQLDLTRFVKWPKYVRIQRQRRILYKRLRVPPAINQFTNTLERQLAHRLFKFLNKYRPEEEKEKKKRLLEEAKKKLEAKKTQTQTQPPKKEEAKKNVIVHGLSQVVNLIERKKASLVVIAHDVDPIELVVFLPGLCKKMGVPYCIVKGKARLGKVVFRKNTCCLALTHVNKEDKTDFDQLVTVLNQQFAEKYLEANRKWGGNELSLRSMQHRH